MDSDLIKDLILLVLGAVLGYLGVWIPYIKKRLITVEMGKRRELLKPARVYDWVLKYHINNSTINDLFKINIERHEFIIPFLIKSSWLYFQKLDIYTEEIIVYRGKGSGFKVDETLIKKKKKLNQKIFDEPTIYIEKVILSSGRVILEVKECRYFEMISSISALEEESLSAIRKKKYKNLSIRDKYLKSTEVAERPHNLPFSVGCVVLLAFKTSEGYELLLQRRSTATATYGGYKSVIPSYGLAPLPNSAVPYSITFYNFIKEFAEELFDYEDLIQHMSSKRGDLLWFLEVPEIKEIIDSFKFGISEYIFTGFGIDILNGTNTLSYLCIINDQVLINRLKSRIKASWESEGEGADLALELVHINNSKLLQEIQSNTFHFGSAFCIMRGIEYIQINNPN